MWEFRDRVAVAGIGYSPLTRRSPRTVASLTVEACDVAITDAGLRRADIDGMATSPAQPRYGGQKGNVDGIDILTPGYLAQLLHITDQVTWLGSTNSMVTHSVMDAVNALVAGACRNAIVYRALHMPAGRYSDFRGPYASGRDQFFAPYGFTMPAAWAATAMRRYMALSGCTRESFANFIVDNRGNANRNPRAFFRDTPLTREEYLGAKMVADPMTMYDCDIPVDGAIAMVLTSAERARDLPNVPALISGYAMSLHQGAGGVPFSLEDLWEGAERLGVTLWRSAGLGPRDMSVAEVYDGFSIFVYSWLEALGFVGRGEAFRFIDDGRARLDGELPVNTGGCSLAEGRVHGMAQIVEAALQVSGRGEKRQVAGAGHAVATISNGLAGSTGFVLTRG